MSLPEGYDPSPRRSPKPDALELGAIPGVLPFAGSRNPMARSSVAHRITTTLATPMDGHRRRLYHFESSLEFAVAIDAMLSGTLHGLEVQLPAIDYPWQGGRKSHHFDLRITRIDGKRIAVFVRNDRSLARVETQDEIDAIFAHIPYGFCDQAVIVGSWHYTRVLQDNLRRIWEATQAPDPEADAAVLQTAGTASYWDIDGLIRHCGIPRARAWRATLRLIGRRVLKADRYAMIDYPSRITLPA
ncbi:hypothetical protein [Wenxinia marina]|uniref:Uncharacterized protein n=1 Tax=Wenxinia marina DSM 24838 TaxID=1123501 RepID=A0A0D0NSQ6_9RHOB|nr:hypothetical protein [Wenxinia marina]KIQ71205.1 hypothetical protein Wenmar_00584 [Wenxinia marina DSM 24838]GGL81648.1 hypothetical protein GCM10011392_40320 [Wenxinia marina]